MLLRYKRPWFLRKRTPHRLHRHDYRKWELAEAWALDVEECSLFEWEIDFADHSVSCTAFHSLHSPLGLTAYRVAFLDVTTNGSNARIELHAKHHYFCTLT